MLDRLEQFFSEGWHRALFATLFGLFALIVVVLIYLIKSKYVPKTVSSTFIWKRSLKHMKKRVPVNFIISLLLIMQILVVIFAAIALANPTIKSEPKGSIIIVDASSSMKAMNPDTEKTRYETAIDKIKQVAEKVDATHTMALIVAGEIPEFLSEKEGSYYVSTRNDAVDAVNKLNDKCAEVETDINAALALAQTALLQNKNSEVYLYTDRMYSYTGQDGEINIVQCTSENKDWNASIISFEDQMLVGGYEFSANIVNKGSTAPFIVTLVVDGSTVATKKIDISSESGTEKLIFSPQANTEKGEIKIKPIKQYQRARIQINAEDIISEDNVAYLTAVPPIDLKVLYVSNHVGKSSQTNLQLSLGASGLVINSSDIYHSDQIQYTPTSGYDLYIYEGVVPYSMPQDGAVWFLNIPETVDKTNIVLSGDKKDKNEDLEELRDLAKDDIISNQVMSYYASKLESDYYRFMLSDELGEIGKRLSKNVDFSESFEIVVDNKPITINSVISKFSLVSGTIDNSVGGGTAIFNVPENFETVYKAQYKVAYTKKTTDPKDPSKTIEVPVVNSDGTIANFTVEAPLLMAGVVDTSRVIVTTFDFTDTSLPIFIADYPILLKNMVEFSMPDILPDRAPVIGDQLQFNAPAGIKSVKYYFKSYDEQMKEDMDGTSTLGTELVAWDNTSTVMPTINLDKLGIYNIVVEYKPQEVMDEDGKPIDVEVDPDLFSVCTYMSLTETDIELSGPKLEVPRATADAQTLKTNRSLLTVFIVIFIILLIVEWGVYYKDEY